MYTFTMYYTYIFLHIQLPFQVCQMPKITFQFQNGPNLSQSGAGTWHNLSSPKN